MPDKFSELFDSFNRFKSIFKKTLLDNITETNEILESKIIPTRKSEELKKPKQQIDISWISSSLFKAIKGLSTLSILNFLGSDTLELFAAESVPVPSSYTNEDGTAFGEFTEAINEYESKEEGYKASWNRWAQGKDFKDMSVDEVIEQQNIAKRTNERTKIPGSKSRSSALGMYQVVGNTLEGLVKGKKIKGSDKFTEETQRKIGWELLIQAGFLSYVNGKMTEDHFIKNLRNVWTGLRTMPDRDIIALIRSMKAKFVKPKEVGNIDELFTFTSRTGDKAHFNKLNPTFRNKIIEIAKKYVKKYNSKVTINSAYRSADEQEHVQDVRGRSHNVENSWHMHGKAIDVPRETLIRLEPYLGEFGLVSGRTFGDPVHIQESGTIPPLVEAKQYEKQIEASITTPEKSSLLMPDIKPEQQQEEEIIVYNERKSSQSSTIMNNNNSNVIVYRIPDYDLEELYS